MPRKRNPITARRMCGLPESCGPTPSSVSRTSLLARRDISHSSAEQIVLPDSFLAVDYMLDRFTWLVEGLVEFTRSGGCARTSRRLGLYFGRGPAQRCVESGLTRDDAYRLVQRNAMRAWDEQIDSGGLVNADPEIAGGSTSTPSSTTGGTRLTSTSSSIGCGRSSGYRPAAHCLRRGATPSREREGTQRFTRTSTTTSGCCSSHRTGSRRST